MKRPIPHHLVLAVAAAEQTGSEAVKARARAIHAVDKATGGTAIRELCAALLGLGLELTSHQVQRARKIGPMLYALHPEGCPPDLAGWWGEEETLYWLARSAEVTRRPVGELLEELRALLTQDAREQQLRVWSGRAEPVNKETWVAPLLPVPDDLAATYRTGHGKVADGLTMTDLQVTHELSRVMNEAPAALWRSLELMDARSMQVIGQALWGALRCLPVSEEEQAPALALVLLNMQPKHWQALHRQLAEALESESKQANKQA
jgi:hypothetical protein